MTKNVQMSEATVPRDADYSAAWRACSKVLTGEAGDLCAKLDNALKAGWSIQARKAYALSVWGNSDCDHISDAEWRLSVEFADSNGCSGGRGFLKRFNANPEHYSRAERRTMQGIYR
jgi:hypothetical protein